MSWITPSDVAAAYPGSDPTQGLIDHVQGLAEGVVGEQTEPVPARLRSVMVEIVRRFHLASDDDPNVESETLGSWTVRRRGGLGLTNAEKRDLKLALGRGELWVAQTTRDHVETAGPNQPQSVWHDLPDGTVWVDESHPSGL